jgi:hypothetical protein
MKMQNDLFIVEREGGEWIDVMGDGGYTCFTSQAEAQDALDNEEDQESCKIVRFSREDSVAKKVAAEIRDIMHTYRKQEASASGVDTPGGLEHMGDVWALLKKWDRDLFYE